MNNTLPEFSWPPIETHLNRRGIDEDNLRHLKAAFVKQRLKVRSESQRDIETVYNLSPDLAVVMLRCQHDREAHVLKYIESVEKAMKILAFKVDADGTIEEQYQEDVNLAEDDAAYESAMNVLRQRSNNGERTGLDQATTDALRHLREMYEGSRSGIRSAEPEADPDDIIY